MVVHLAGRRSRWRSVSSPSLPRRCRFDFRSSSSLAIYVLPWLQSTPTVRAPGARPPRGPAKWSRSARLLERFSTWSPRDKWPPHPAFGLRRLRGVLAYRHYITSGNLESDYTNMNIPHRARVFWPYVCSVGRDGLRHQATGRAPSLAVPSRTRSSATGFFTLTYKHRRGDEHLARSGRPPRLPGAPAAVMLGVIFWMYWQLRTMKRFSRSRWR